MFINEYERLFSAWIHQHTDIRTVIVMIAIGISLALLRK